VGVSAARSARTALTHRGEDYAPGLWGWWSYLRVRDLLAECRTGYAPDRTAARQALLRRLRPSARLQQSNVERAWWLDRVRNLEEELGMAQEEAAGLRRHATALAALPVQVVEPPRPTAATAGELQPAHVGWTFHTDSPPTDGVLLLVERRDVGDPPWPVPEELSPADRSPIDTYAGGSIPGGFTTHLLLQVPHREEPLHMWCVGHTQVVITPPGA